MRRLNLLFALSLLGLGACAHPCDTLADKACKTAGESSQECKQIRERADHPSPDDRRACEVALDLVGELEKVR